MITYYEDNRISVAVLERTKKGSYCSGDAHLVIQTDNYAMCVVTDGLGSGIGAQESASAIIETVKWLHPHDISEIIEACNENMLYKRGAVLTLMKIDYFKKEIHYSNVGNIGFSFYLSDGEEIQTIPSRGFLSGKKQKASIYSFKYDHGSTFILYSDGLKSPPSKDTFLQLKSIKGCSDRLFEQLDYNDDDVTIMLGKL